MADNEIETIYSPLPLDITNGFQNPDPYCGYAPTEHKMAAKNIQISENDYLCMIYIDPKDVYNNFNKYKWCLVKLQYNHRTYHDLVTTFLYYCMSQKMPYLNANDEIELCEETIIEHGRKYGGHTHFIGFKKYKNIWVPMCDS